MCDDLEFRGVGKPKIKQDIPKDMMEFLLNDVSEHQQIKLVKYIMDKMVKNAPKKG